MNRATRIVTLVCVCVVAAHASDVQGTITLDARMVRKIVPPSVYDLRGMTLHDQHAIPSGPGGLGRIAIWLEGGPEFASPTTSTIQQHGRRFEPDLLIVPTGSKVMFPNLDPFFHNIFSLSRTHSFDLGYYAAGKNREVVFSQSGVVQVYCHVHPEMYAVIVVTPSRWTARSAADGTFRLSDVPAGKYRVVVWQRSAGFVRKSIAVPPSGAVRVDFRLPDEEADR